MMPSIETDTSLGDLSNVPPLPAGVWAGDGRGGQGVRFRVRGSTPSSSRSFRFMSSPPA